MTGDEDLDPAEIEWKNERDRAMQRQLAVAAKKKHPAEEHDLQIKAIMERDRQAVRAAAVTPGGLSGASASDPFDMEAALNAGTPLTSTPIPGTPTHMGQAAVQPAAANLTMTLWTCVLTDGKILYAASWDDMKKTLLEHQGEWIASQHELVPTAQNIIKFFTENSNSETVKKTYEIIVANGKVFRADS